MCFRTATPPLPRPAFPSSVRTASTSSSASSVSASPSLTTPPLPITKLARPPTKPAIKMMKMNEVVSFKDSTKRKRELAVETKKIERLEREELKQKQKAEVNKQPREVKEPKKKGRPKADAAEYTEFPGDPQLWDPSMAAELSGSMDFSTMPPNFANFLPSSSSAAADFSSQFPPPQDASSSQFPVQQDPSSSSSSQFPSLPPELLEQLLMNPQQLADNPELLAMLTSQMETLMPGFSNMLAQQQQLPPVNPEGP